MAQLMGRDSNENCPEEEFKDEGSKKSLSCCNYWAECLLKECK